MIHYSGSYRAYLRNDLPIKKMAETILLLVNGSRDSALNICTVIKEEILTALNISWYEAKEKERFSFWMSVSEEIELLCMSESKREMNKTLEYLRKYKVWPTNYTDGHLEDRIKKIWHIKIARSEVPDEAVDLLRNLTNLNLLINHEKRITNIRSK